MLDPVIVISEYGCVCEVGKKLLGIFYKLLYDNGVVNKFGLYELIFVISLCVCVCELGANVLGTPVKLLYYN